VADQIGYPIPEQRMLLACKMRPIIFSFWFFAFGRFAEKDEEGHQVLNEFFDLSSAKVLLLSLKFE